MACIHTCPRTALPWGYMIHAPRCFPFFSSSFLFCLIRGPLTAPPGRCCHHEHPQDAAWLLSLVYDFGPRDPPRPRSIRTCVRSLPHHLACRYFSLVFLFFHNNTFSICIMHLTYLVFSLIIIMYFLTTCLQFFLRCPAGLGGRRARDDGEPGLLSLRTGVCVCVCVCE